MPEISVTVGADPELFLMNGRKPIPAIGLIGGTKEEPLPCECGALQEDNVAAEFNIDPASTEDQFIHNINTVMEHLRAKVAPNKLRITPSLLFPKKVLQTAGPQALEFGCVPDYNAWSLSENESPSPFTTQRTAGGHIHAGFEAANTHQKYEVIKMMDFLIGVPSVILDSNSDRRAMYGRAGACRTKPYGVEYRVPSNFWLKSERLMSWIYTQTVEAVHKVEMINKYLLIFPPDCVINTINNSDRPKAEEIVDTLKIAMP